MQHHMNRNFTFRLIYVMIYPISYGIADFNWHVALQSTTPNAWHAALIDVISVWGIEVDLISE